MSAFRIRSCLPNPSVAYDSLVRGGRRSYVLRLRNTFHSPETKDRRFGEPLIWISRSRAASPTFPSILHPFCGALDPKVRSTRLGLRVKSGVCNKQSSKDLIQGYEFLRRSKGLGSSTHPPPPKAPFDPWTSQIIPAPSRHRGWGWGLSTLRVNRKAGDRGC